MFAVIFRAEINELDDSYIQTTAQMKALAINRYGCIEFASVTEGSHEISISYWESQEQIKRWKHDPQHLEAQELGRTKWYQSYHVQIVEVVREYG